MMLRREAAPLTAAQLEASISEMRGQIGGLQRRLPDLDEATTATATLLSEAEDKLRQQEGEVCRLQLATGRAFSFGGRDLPRQTWTDGRGTRRVTGPADANTPQGRAEDARRLYDALEAEVRPIRAALVSLERERADVVKGISLRQGEIEAHERQLQQLHAAEVEHERLTGRLGWRSRLAAILRTVRAA